MLFKDFTEATFVFDRFVGLGPVLMSFNFGKFGLDIIRDHQAKVHVGRLLEFALSDEAIGAMLGSGRPANAVVGVELDPRLAFILIHELQTIVVHHDVRTTPLHFVRRDGGLDRFNGWCDDGRETFLVHWTLDRHVWEWSAGQSYWKHRRVESAIQFHLFDGADHLRETADDDLREELYQR